MADARGFQPLARLCLPGVSAIEWVERVFQRLKVGRKRRLKNHLFPRNRVFEAQFRGVESLLHTGA